MLGKALRSKHIFPNDHEDPIDGYLLIRGEKIESILPFKGISLKSIEENYDVIDYSDLYIFPGLIDHNVHLNSTYEDNWNDCQNVTKMAAQGGITTIIDGPIMNRVDENQSMTISLRMASLTNKIFVDVGIMAYLDIKFSELLENSGVIGFKGYLSPPFLNSIPKLSIHSLYKIKKTLENTDLPVVLCMHCEEANERDLFMPSPLRCYDKKKRLDPNVDIKNLKAFGGGHQGNLNDELSSGTSLNEEEHDKVFDLIMETNKLKNNTTLSPTTADLKKFSFLEAKNQDEKYIALQEYEQYKGGGTEEENKEFFYEELSRNFDSMNLNFNSSLALSEMSDDFSDKKLDDNSIDEKLNKKNEVLSPVSSIRFKGDDNSIFKDTMLGTINAVNTEKEIMFEEVKGKTQFDIHVSSKDEMADSEQNLMLVSAPFYKGFKEDHVYSQSPEIITKKKFNILERRMKGKQDNETDTISRRKKANSLDPKGFLQLTKISTIKVIDNPESLQQEKNICRMYKNFLFNHPLAWETSGVNLLLKIFRNIKKSNCNFLLTNLSSSSLAYIIRDERKKKKEDLNFYVDTSIPYIFFSMDLIKDGQTKFKVSPPIRDKAEQKLIIKSLRKGVFDTVSSYHLQTPIAYKNIDRGNFRKAFDGTSCIGFNLSVVWTRFYLYEKEKLKKMKSPLSKLEFDKNLNQIFHVMIKNMCSKPAEIFKIEHQKGELAKGKDADVLVWNPFVVKKIEKDDILLKYPKLFILRGYKVYGEVQATFLRGGLIFQMEKDGKDFIQRGKVLKRGVNI